MIEKVYIILSLKQYKTQIVGINVMLIYFSTNIYQIILIYLNRELHLISKSKLSIVLTTKNNTLYCIENYNANYQISQISKINQVKFLGSSKTSKFSSELKL